MEFLEMEERPRILVFGSSDHSFTDETFLREYLKLKNDDEYTAFLSSIGDPRHPGPLEHL
jgi:hypothetical protein